MAKINEQTLTFKLSQLLRNEDTEQNIVSDEDLVVLIEALKSMVGEAVLIELE